LVAFRLKFKKVKSEDWNYLIPSLTTEAEHAIKVRVLFLQQYVPQPKISIVCCVTGCSNDFLSLVHFIILRFLYLPFGVRGGAVG
jgi:hypothetical protein